MGVSLLESSGALVSSGEDTDRDSPCLLLASEAARSEHGFSASERAATQKERGRERKRVVIEGKRTRTERRQSYVSLASSAHITCATSIGSPPTAVAARERAARCPSARDRARSGLPSSPTRRLLEEARRCQISFQISMVQDETGKRRAACAPCSPLLNGPLQQSV